MSMVMKVFLEKEALPVNKEIQQAIQALGYDFTIKNDPRTTVNNDGLTCTINGHECYIEAYVATSIDSDEDDWVIPHLTDQNAAISFIWGADYAAGACIGLISAALIDLAGAVVAYTDDQMIYTREMLIDETPLYLKQLTGDPQPEVQQVRPSVQQQKAGFRKWIKNVFS